KVVGESTKDLLAKNGVILGVADALLQKGTGAVKDAADQAIDEGKKAAEDAVKSIFDILGN
ncbi:hypothetical protein N9956_02325, partial [Akkermansiaceae bacterium]|nr:hypothetical protein [Akkermansiaceae bacterium]